MTRCSECPRRARAFVLRTVKNTLAFSAFNESAFHLCVVWILLRIQKEKYWNVVISSKERQFKKSLLLNIPAVSVYYCPPLLASVNIYDFYHHLKLTQQKWKDRFDSTCFVLADFPSLGPLQMVWGSKVGDVEGEKSLMWLCLQLELESAELAPKGEEQPSPCCWCVSKPWNGITEMRWLKYTEMRHSVMRGLVPLQKGKEAQNYNTLYNLVITALMKQKPSKSTLLTVTDKKSLL